MFEDFGIDKYIESDGDELEEEHQRRWQKPLLRTPNAHQLRITPIDDFQRIKLYKDKLPFLDLRKSVWKAMK